MPLPKDVSRLLGTWKLRSYEREEIATGRQHDRFPDLGGNTLTITTAPYRNYLDGKKARSILVWNKVTPR